MNADGVAPELWVLSERYGKRCAVLDGIGWTKRSKLGGQHPRYIPTTTSISTALVSRRLLPCPSASFLRVSLRAGLHWLPVRRLLQAARAGVDMASDPINAALQVLSGCRSASRIS